MGNSFDQFRRVLRDRLAPRGAQAEFCRATGISRSVVDRWLDGEGEPSLESLDRIASALGLQPWELIRPEGAQATPAPQLDTGELGEVVAALMQNPERLADVRALLGLAKPAAKRKTR